MIESEWYEARTGTGAITDVHERRAATLAAAHANTPSVTHLDSLGRPFLVQADNGPDPANPSEHLLYDTRTELDIEGNQLAIIDALGIRTFEQQFDVLGRRIAVTSPDAGRRHMVADTADVPLRSWDSRGHTVWSRFDALRRPTHAFVQQSEDPLQQVVGRTVYGESLDGAEFLNLRGRAYLAFDCAGLLRNEGFDFKGNLLSSTRHLASEYASTPQCAVPRA